MSSVGKSAISIRDLCVSFSRWGQNVIALNGINLDVEPGEWVLIVGHNGAGKSTLLRAISGQLRASSGEVRIGGRRVRTLASRTVADLIFAVQQDPLNGTAPLLTVFENLLVADRSSESARATKSALRERYASRLVAIDLGERIDQPVKLLSTGERQLLAFVIAELRSTPIVLLDEPFAALDSKRTEICLNRIAGMHKEGRTIVQVAHDIELLRPLADRLCELDHGRVSSVTNVKASAITK